MASGLIMLAHNSAGPKMDIVCPVRGEKSGFLAETEEQYAETLYSIYKMTPQKRTAIREAAREQVKKFSQEKFNEDFLDTFRELCLLKFLNSKKNN
jgi:alpha-1,2-mannosyltransferase